MNIKSLLASVAFAVSSVSAMAGTATFNDGLALFNNDAFTSTGAFTQTITFVNDSSSIFRIKGAVSGTNLSFSSISFNGTEYWDKANATYFNTKYGFGAINVVAQEPMTLVLSGTAFKGATFSGSVAAVPEPESYAMLLAGLGLMGTIIRRRSRKSAE